MATRDCDLLNDTDPPCTSESSSSARDYRRHASGEHDDCVPPSTALSTHVPR